MVFFMVGTRGLIFVSLNRTGAHQLSADRRSPTRLSLVVEPPSSEFQTSYHKKILPQGQDFFMVGTRGFEPPTSCTPCKRSTRLNYVPILFIIIFLFFVQEVSDFFSCCVCFALQAQQLRFGHSFVNLLFGNSLCL